MLIALLISLLFGPYGPEVMFTIPDMEERLTTYAQLRAEIIRKVDLAEISKDLKQHTNTKTSVSTCTCTYVHLRSAIQNRLSFYSVLSAL